jgi:DNA-directed RNA polymerase specialized sigma24 family protein
MGHEPVSEASDESSDELLWSQAADGRRVAFGDVFDRHVRAVYRHCRRLSSTVSDAEDLTSLVFLEAWRGRDRVRFVDGSVRPWLLATATNVARNASRARRRYDAVLARLPHDQPLATSPMRSWRT